MNPDPSKLRQQQEQAEQAVESLGHQEAQSVQQFSSVEEMIRFDAKQTLPPDSLAERLQDAISREPKPTKSWWQRLFSRDN
jgi:hypothetical protein